MNRFYFGADEPEIDPGTGSTPDKRTGKTKPQKSNKSTGTQTSSKKSKSTGTQTSSTKRKSVVSTGTQTSEQEEHGPIIHTFTDLDLATVPPRLRNLINQNRRNSNAQLLLDLPANGPYFMPDGETVFIKESFKQVDVASDGTLLFVTPDNKRYTADGAMSTIMEIRRPNRQVVYPHYLGPEDEEGSFFTLNRNVGNQFNRIIGGGGGFYPGFDPWAERRAQGIRAPNKGCWYGCVCRHNNEDLNNAFKKLGIPNASKYDKYEKCDILRQMVGQIADEENINRTLRRGRRQFNPAYSISYPFAGMGLISDDERELTAAVLSEIMVENGLSESSQVTDEHVKSYIDKNTSSVPEYNEAFQGIKGLLDNYGSMKGKKLTGADLENVQRAYNVLQTLLNENNKKKENK